MNNIEFNPFTSFSQEVYELSYKYGNDKGIDDTISRMVTAVASTEKDSVRESVMSEFSEIITDFAFVPAGRIWSNAGIDLNGTSMINCFVDGFTGKDQDSIHGISSALERQAKILKSEGGYGFCVDVLRPRGAYINGIGGESIGAIGMLELWQSQSNVFTKGNEFQDGKRKKGKKKIRNGAQMATISIWHPDVEEFIDAKQRAGYLTRMNMSVLITDKFIYAVKNDLDWYLIFPDFESNINDYENLWDGNIERWKSNNLPVKVYKVVKARWLWNKLTRNSYDRNEPAMLFIDRINNQNNLRSIEYINATNPCGEQPLPIGGACLLGSINLVKFVNSDENIDWDKLSHVIRYAVRFLDNVNDITYVPLKSQRENLLNKRRIGLGIMGLASALMMMKLRYGSQQAVAMSDKIMKFITERAYTASVALAIEKEPFPLFESVKEDYVSSPFIQRLPESLRNNISNFGIRNSHLISIQPTGNTSIFAGVVSGGLEPVFSPTYVRTSRVPIIPIGFGDLPINMSGDNDWEEIREGDEKLLKRIFNGTVYKYNTDRGLLKETVIKDYAVRWHESRGSWDAEADWAIGASALDVQDHIDMMQSIAKYVDSAMSKTINLPHDYSFDDFKDVYMNAYDSGYIKGLTTYRDGTMSTVLAEVNKDVNDSNDRDAIAEVITVGDKRFVSIIGFESGDPYEIFVIECINGECNFNRKLRGSIIKQDGQYHFISNEVSVNNIASANISDSNAAAMIKMISIALRYGASVDDIINQLTDNPFMNPIIIAVISSLQNLSQIDDIYKCPICGGKVVLEEGCKKCMDCSWSACSV